MCLFPLLCWSGVPGKLLECHTSDLVGHLSRCLSVLARHWLWRFFSSLVDWITLVTKPGQLRMPVCHTALYRLAVFTVLPYTGGQRGRYTSMHLWKFPFHVIRCCSDHRDHTGHPHRKYGPDKQTGIRAWYPLAT